MKLFWHQTTSYHLNAYIPPEKVTRKIKCINLKGITRFFKCSFLNIIFGIFYLETLYLPWNIYILSATFISTFSSSAILPFYIVWYCQTKYPMEISNNNKKNLQAFIMSRRFSRWAEGLMLLLLDFLKVSASHAF